LKKAADSGITTRKTIVTPCIVNSSLKTAGDTMLWSGCASCTRIRRASTPPTRKKPNAVIP
jgi:hypothetical protein